MKLERLLFIMDLFVIILGVLTVVLLGLWLATNDDEGGEAR